MKTSIKLFKQSWKTFFSIDRTFLRSAGTVKRMFRRKYYLWFKKSYVMGQIKKRKGKCGNHGCCDLTIFRKIRRCPNLSREDRTKCLRWGCLPKDCQIYPFDEKDKIPETRGYCNFYWEER